MKRLGTKAVIAGVVFIEGNEDNVRSRGLAAPYARFDRTRVTEKDASPLGYANYQFDVARCD